MARILSIITLVFFAFALGDYHKPADITGPEIILGFTAVPMSLLAVILVIYGAFEAVRSSNRTYYVSVALCAAPLAILLGVSAIKRTRESNMAMRSSEWGDKADAIADLFAEYYKSHPDQIRRIEDSEAVVADGFLAFCKTRPEFKKLSIDHDSKHVLDFRGEPVIFYIDFNRDGTSGIVRAPIGAVSVSDSKQWVLGISPRDPHRKADWEEFLRTGRQTYRPPPTTTAE